MTRGQLIRRLALLYKVKAIKSDMFERLVWMLNSGVNVYEVLYYTIN